MNYKKTPEQYVWKPGTRVKVYGLFESTDHDQFEEGGIYGKTGTVADAIVWKPHVPIILDDYPKTVWYAHNKQCRRLKKVK